MRDSDTGRSSAIARRAEGPDKPRRRVRESKQVSLIAALRASDLGVRIDGVHVPAVMLMDDLAILARSEREMEAMARVVFDWSHKNRFVLALVDKSHICRGVPRTAADDAARLRSRLTYTPPGADAATRAAATIDVTLRHEPVVCYLGFLLSETAGSAAHAASARKRARKVIARMRIEYGGHALVTIGQAKLMWEVHGRGILEWPSGAVPPGGARYADRYQADAFKAILGRSCASNVSYETLLIVFDAWSIDERILRGRGRYTYDFSRTRRRPERRALFDALTGRLSETGFAARSVTGAVEDALTTLGLGSWPAIGECGEGTGEADTPAAEKESWRSRVDRRVSRLVQARIRKTFTARKSCLLLRAIAGRRPSAAALEGLGQWLRRCVLNMTANDGGCSLVALLAGAWWAAPVPRVRESGFSFFSAPRCGACGRESSSLPIHLCLGCCSGEPACPDLAAGLARADWKTRVDKLFRDHGDAPSRRALAAAPPFSYERLALMIGRAHGTDLPWALQVRLPGAFAESMGKWSRKELTRQGA